MRVSYLQSVGTFSGVLYLYRQHKALPWLLSNSLTATVVNVPINSDAKNSVYYFSISTVEARSASIWRHLAHSAPLR